MKTSKRIYCITIVSMMLILTVLHGQNAVVTSGGSFSGEAGSLSYTIGQIGYETIAADDGKAISAGVQQPFELFEITLGKEEAIVLNLKIYAYPNPTTSNFTLKIEDDHFYTRWPKGLILEILDINGRLVMREKIYKKISTLNVQNLDESTYFLNILNKREVIKSFKIVKGL